MLEKVDNVQEKIDDVINKRKEKVDAFILLGLYDELWKHVPDPPSQGRSYYS